MPTIVGTGLTGLLISRALDRASVPHVLIGGAPPRTPRLGESLNLEGTLGALESIPELAQHFVAKREVVGYIGERVLTCDFAIRRHWAARALFRLLGHTAPRELLNIDRVDLDPALHALVVASPTCHAVDARVDSIEHDPRSDLVTELRLSSGDTLRPGYVFDATNQARLVARAAGVPVRTMGDPERVAFAHYRLPEGAPAGTVAGWEATTTILRLARDPDGVDAMAWVIPLPGYVSVGASHAVGEDDPSPEALLDAVEAAVARRGIVLRAPYALRTVPVAIPFRHYAHERAYGPNWLLAGPSYAQIWWMSGSGVGTSFAAARVAPRVLHDPRGVGAAYQSHMEQLLTLHDVFEWFARVDVDAATSDGVAEHADRFVMANLQRLLSSVRCFGRRGPAAVGAAVAPFLRRSRPGRSCVVGAGRPATLAAPRGAEPEVVTPPDRSGGIIQGEPAMFEGHVALIRQLAEVLDGRGTVALGDAIIAEDVVCHMDGLTFRGRTTWRNWIVYILSQPHVSNLRARVDFIEVDDRGIVTLSGRWQGLVHGTPSISDPAAARYRIREGRVVEIWTTRRNYAFMLGSRMRHWPGCLATLLRMARWTRSERLASALRGQPAGA